MPSFFAPLKCQQQRFIQTKKYKCDVEKRFCIEHKVTLHVNLHPTVHVFKKVCKNAFLCANSHGLVNFLKNPSANIDKRCNLGYTIYIKTLKGDAYADRSTQKTCL